MSKTESRPLSNTYCPCSSHMTPQNTQSLIITEHFAQSGKLDTELMDTGDQGPLHEILNHDTLDNKGACNDGNSTKATNFPFHRQHSLAFLDMVMLASHLLQSSIQFSPGMGLRARKFSMLSGSQLRPMMST